MASILSQYSSTGFYNAPVSKGLMGYMVLTCTALNVPMFAQFKKHLICKLPDVLLKGEFWRIPFAKLSFIDNKDILFGSLLIYYFRIFERRYGSYKFASYLVASQVISTLLEVSTLLFLHWCGLDLYGGGYLPPGPYGLVFPLFASYYLDIPRVAQTTLLGIPITGKTLTYILGLQVCSTSAANFISALCALVAGLAHRYNVCLVRQVTWVPRWVAAVGNATLGPLLASAPPEDGPVGATLELQRQEQIDNWEQQMMMDRAREFRNRPMVNGDIHPFMQNIIGGRRGNNPGMNGGGAAGGGAAPPPPSQEHVDALVEMGFERERVLSALRTSHDDLNTATHILLQQT